MYEDAIILGIIFGFTAFICALGYKAVKLKLSKDNNIPEETFNRLAKAFLQHKKDTERRLQHLEAIISDEKESVAPEKSQSPKSLSEPRQTIEIEDDEHKTNAGEQTNDGDKLRNMLKN